MKVAIRHRSDPLVAGLLLLLLSLFVSSGNVHAYPEPGTSALNPGQTVLPGLIPNGTPAGTLVGGLSLASSDYVLVEAVYREPTGTLDFYYQIDSLSLTQTLTTFVSSSWAGYATSVGYRLDGSTIRAVPPGFFNGTSLPISASLSADGSTLGFTFIPGISGSVGVGASVVFMVSTNATGFTDNGSGRITGTTLSGGAIDFAVRYSEVPTGPAVPVATPEPGDSIWLLGLAIFALVVAARTFASQQVTGVNLRIAALARR